MVSCCKKFGPKEDPDEGEVTNGLVPRSKRKYVLYSTLQLGYTKNSHSLVDVEMYFVVSCLLCIGSEWYVDVFISGFRMNFISFFRL